MEEIANFYAIYKFECFDKDKNLKWVKEIKNLIPTVGKNKLLDACLKTGLTTPTWYVGLKNTGIPVVGDTMASHASWTENTSYANATRPVFTPGTISGGSVNNTAAKAEFDINASTTIFGAFVVDNNTKGGTTGTLLSVGDFSASEPVDGNDTLKVTVTFTVT